MLYIGNIQLCISTTIVTATIWAWKSLHRSSDVEADRAITLSPSNADKLLLATNLFKHGRRTAFTEQRPHARVRPFWWASAHPPLLSVLVLWTLQNLGQTHYCEVCASHVKCTSKSLLNKSIEQLDLPGRNTQELQHFIRPSIPTTKSLTSFHSGITSIDFFYFFFWFLSQFAQFLLPLPFHPI